MPAARRDDLLVVAAAVVPLGLFVLRERALAGASGFPLDDAWIHLHFARNIAEGHGFAYNPGVPMAGSTAPLWTLALALGAMLVGPSVALAKTLGIAAAIAAALIVRRTALAFGCSSAVALVAAVGLLWSRPMAWGALSGMEVSLAALLVAGALFAHAKDRVVVAATLAALAVLARPEAALFVLLLVVAAPLTFRRVAIFAAVTVAVVLPAVWFNMATAGAPVPATAAAKIEGGLLGWLTGVRESAMLTWIVRPWRFGVAWVAWLGRTHWLLPLALIPGMVAVALRAGRRLAVPALSLLAHPIGMALLAPYRDPGFQEGRYSIHLLPLAVLVLAVGLSPLRPVTRRTVLVGYLAIALITLPTAAERYGWAVQNINGMQVSLGRWVDATLPRSARLAVNDIGAIAYFSRRPVIDLMGLVTPEIIPYRRQGERGVIRYIQQTCPDYVIVFPAWFPELARRDDLLIPIHRVRLDHNEVSGADEMVVYRLGRCAV